MPIRFVQIAIGIEPMTVSYRLSSLDPGAKRMTAARAPLLRIVQLSCEMIISDSVTAPLSGSLS
jgi:hypothetical protein